jgi:hypothetical protein
MIECISCGSDRIENRDLKLCSTCAHAIRKAERMKAPKDKEPVAKVSVKMGKQLSKYAAQKAKWIKGKKCAVHPNQPATQVHHMAGRVGYADEWARENDVPLLLDERFWLPVSHEGHEQINNNPVWAWENQYSFKRVSDPIFIKK